MTPTLNKYTDSSGYYIKARPPEVGHVTYQLTPQTEEFITELGYSDSEELPWGVINPLKEAGEIYTQGTGVEQESQSAPELSPGSLPELSEDEADAIIEYLEETAGIDSDIVNQVKENINAEPDEPNISRLSDRIEESIELPSPNGNDWEITSSKSGDVQSDVSEKNIRFDRGENAEYMSQHYVFEQNEDSEQYVLSEILMPGSGYDDRIGIALSHQRIILNCLSQLSETLDSHDMSLTKESSVDQVVDVTMMFSVSTLGDSH